MKKLFTLLLFGCSFIVKAQVIVTVAGNGNGSSSGDGSAALASEVSNPAFGAFDAKGNYYFGEGHASTGSKVRMIDIYGVIKTVAGSGVSGFSGDNAPATLAKIGDPRVCVDAAGNIFIADYDNYRVRKVDVSTGIIHTIAGNGTNSSSGNGGLATAATIVPIDVCVDYLGNVFISDQKGNSIRKIDRNTGIITQIASTSAQGMCIDANGNLFLGGGSRVFKVNVSSGKIDTIAGTGLTFYNGNHISAIKANFTVFDIDRDRWGNIYIADHGNELVRVVDNSGIIHTIAGTGVGGFGGDGGSATSAMIYNPEGVAIDTCGNIYIAASGNNRIRKISYPKCHYLETEALPQVSSQISIYPNPSNDILHIDNLQTTATYRLLSMVGAVLQLGGLKEGNNTINIAELPVGMYLVEVSNAAVGLRMMYKIVKQ